MLVLVGKIRLKAAVIAEVKTPRPAKTARTQFILVPPATLPDLGLAGAYGPQSMRPLESRPPPLRRSVVIDQNDLIAKGAQSVPQQVAVGNNGPRQGRRKHPQTVRPTAALEGAPDPQLQSTTIGKFRVPAFSTYSNITTRQARNFFSRGVFNGYFGRSPFKSQNGRTFSYAQYSKYLQ